MKREASVPNFDVGIDARDRASLRLLLVAVLWIASASAGRASEDRVPPAPPEPGVSAPLDDHWYLFDRTFARDSRARPNRPSREELARMVDVRAVEVTLPKGRREAGQAMWDAFAETPRVQALGTISFWCGETDRYRSRLADALVDSAQAKGLPSASLARCLQLMYARHGRNRMSVAAYLARHDGAPIWVIVERWGFADYDGTVVSIGHLALRGYRVDADTLVCATSCG